MNKFIALILIFSCSVHAQVPVNAGEQVPADGIFLTAKDTATIIAEKRAAVQRCQVKWKKEYDILLQECEYEKELLRNEIIKLETQAGQLEELNDTQQKKIEELMSSGSNNLVYFSVGLAAGIISAIVVGLVSIYTYNEATK